MKRIAFLFLMAAALFTAAPAHADDTVFEKAGDWFATIGKSQAEKDQILLQRRMDRAAKKLQQGFERGAKQTEKNMNDLGKDLKKTFNS